MWTSVPQIVAALVRDGYQMIFGTSFGQLELGVNGQLTLSENIADVAGPGTAITARPRSRARRAVARAAEPLHQVHARERHVQLGVAEVLHEHVVHGFAVLL